MSDEPARPGSVEIVLHPGPDMTAHIEGSADLPYVVITGPYVTAVVMPLGPDATDADLAAVDAIADNIAEYRDRLHLAKARSSREADVHP